MKKHRHTSSRGADTGTYQARPRRGDDPNYLGGSYPGTKLWLDTSRLEVDALSAANTLVIAPGLLTGYPVFTANRTSFVSKSPLTGLLSESTVGGYFGPKLRAAGYDALVLKGSSRVPCDLFIDGDAGTAEIEYYPDLPDAEAPDYWCEYWVPIR